MKELSEVSGSLAREEQQGFPASRQGQTGGYQSRVFSFLNRQANRLRGGIGQGWRQVRVSVQMTGQILLLPLRLLARWTKGGSPSMSGKTSSSLPPVADQPVVAIERILAEFSAAGYGELATAEPSTPIYEDWSAIDEQEWDTSLLSPTQRSLAGRTTAMPVSTRPVIRGLASRLSDRQLILVDRHNQLLDVLSPSQQLHIRQRIDPQLLLSTEPGWAIAGKTAALGALPSTRSTPQTLNAAKDLRLPAAAQHPIAYAPDTGKLTPKVPAGDQPLLTTVVQQLHYWFDFYREYLRVAEEEPDPASTDQAVALQLLPPHAAALETQPEPSTTMGTQVGVGSQSLARDWANRSKQPPSGTKKTALRPIDPAVGHTVFTPEWIETPTRPLGYERSWLARCLEWLDGVVLAIENWIISWYRRLFG